MKRLTRSVDPVESRSPVSDVHRSLWWLARLLLLNALSTSSEVKFTLYREADTDRSVAVKVVRVRAAEPSLNASPGRPIQGSNPGSTQNFVTPGYNPGWGRSHWRRIRVESGLELSCKQGFRVGS